MKLNENIQKQIFRLLHQVFTDVSDSRTVGTLLEDLGGRREHLTMAKRLAVAIYLDKGRAEENIKQTLKVSAVTIEAVKKLAGNPGFQEALKRVKAEDWAQTLTDKINCWLKSIKKG